MGNALNIRFTNKTDYEDGLAFGEIRLNDFVENFESPLTFWDAAHYEQQWKDGIARLLKGAQRSCVITSIVDPQNEADCFGVWWTLYRDGEYVVAHNQLLLTEVLGRFDPENPYEFIPARASVSPDGEPISEWRVRLDGISLPAQSD